MNRRKALSQAMAMLCAAALPDLPLAQQASRSATQPNAVFVHDLPDVTLHGWQVHVSYVHMPPGRVGKPHRHPGFVLAYVLEGAVVTKISGQPERTYRQGEMFYEPPDSVHEVSRNPSPTRPATLLALILAPKGVPLVMPA